MVDTVVTMDAASTVVLPTLGRPSLPKAVSTLENQTTKIKVIVKNDLRDTLVKIKEGVAEATTETVLIADDDAVYPDDWAKMLLSAYGEGIGFVGGPCLPLLDGSSSDAERCIAEVTASFFGTSNMSYRAKVKGKTRDADETNLVGNGLYRREVLAQILTEEFDRIPPAAWETYVFIRIRKMGYRTLFNPRASFYHRQRNNIISFSIQIMRSGIGRMNFFKRFPTQLITKFWMLFPMLFLLYMTAFFGLALGANYGISSLPLIGYVGVLTLVSFGLNRHKSKWLAFYFLAMHLSYGLGMLVGLFRSQKTWT